ncbi:DNA primase [Commensalibacter communis]|uniref:hypothetical protein n=1 Tax=Commensalibacter communis TaxID=2972786 RepID=UPI0022FF8785|nr:hypothetical protein [Commensalibacter communis]CAI3959701.1 DNA primase [Commensalibacter communis]CAI3960548.1 DNA primase [Commensalibacter communis]CAI3961542.1 DNA primase [Commensalibacter communis]
MKNNKINFNYVSTLALKNIEAILRNWLPDGRNIGGEWVARNPTRSDHKAGSFKINLRSGRWSDFATGDRGGDLIALAAYLFGLSQGEAARKLADMLGIEAINE